MSTTEEHKVDRKGWPAGPWDQEPDKIQWKTDTGLPALIVRNELGGLCGYVAVAEGHPCYGKDYTSEYETGDDGEPDYACRKDNPVNDLCVHGGITYGNKCAGPICHIPEPGEPDDVWWLGFDCGHAGDAMPGMLTHGMTAFAGSDYRGVDYVTRQCERLAVQLEEMA